MADQPDQELQGRYIDRNSITVAAYLDQWLEAHAVEVKRPWRRARALRMARSIA